MLPSPLMLLVQYTAVALLRSTRVTDVGGREYVWGGREVKGGEGRGREVKGGEGR
jgi:hypothetical protein